MTTPGASTTVTADAVGQVWPCDRGAYDMLGGGAIGKGAFAEVWKVKCLENDTTVAAKIIDLAKVSSSFEDIRQEVQIMQMAKHKNILACHCSFVHRQNLWLVMQWMNKGSCLHVLRSLHRQGLRSGLTEPWVATIVRETLQGLEYFHGNGQIHRDIKAGNILLDENGRVVLSDFGVSGWLADGWNNRQRSTFVGTPCWMAPEVMEQKLDGYDSKADIWSLGITVLELAKGKAPYAHFPPMKVLLLTLQEDPPSLDSYDDQKDSTGKDFSKHFKDFVKKCLQKEPTERPDCTKLLKHKFLSQAIKQETLAAELLTKLPNLEPPAAVSSASAGACSRSYSGAGTAVTGTLPVPPNASAARMSPTESTAEQGHTTVTNAPVHTVVDGTDARAIAVARAAADAAGVCGRPATEAESDDDVAASTASRVGALELSPNVSSAQPPVTPATDERASGASWDFSKATATDIQKNSKKEEDIPDVDFEQVLGVSEDTPEAIPGTSRGQPPTEPQIAPAIVPAMAPTAPPVIEAEDTLDDLEAAFGTDDGMNAPISEQ